MTLARLICGDVGLWRRGQGSSRARWPIVVSLVMAIAATSCTEGTGSPGSAPTQTEPARDAADEVPLDQAPDPRMGQVPDLGDVAQRDRALAAMALHAFDVGDDLSHLAVSAAVPWIPLGGAGLSSDVVPLEDGELAQSPMLQSYRTFYEDFSEVTPTRIGQFENEVSLHPDESSAAAFVQLGAAELQQDLELMTTGDEERSSIPNGVRLLWTGGEYNSGAAFFSAGPIVSYLSVVGGDADDVADVLDRATERSRNRIAAVVEGQVGFGPLPDVADHAEDARWTFEMVVDGQLSNAMGAFERGGGRQCTYEEVGGSIRFTASGTGSVRVEGTSVEPAAIVPEGAVDSFLDCGRPGIRTSPRFAHNRNSSPEMFLGDLPDLQAVPAFRASYAGLDAVRYDLRDAYRRFVGPIEDVTVDQFDLWLHPEQGWAIGYAAVLSGDFDDLCAGCRTVEMHYEIEAVNSGTVEIPPVTESLSAVPVDGPIVFSASVDGAPDVFVMSPAGQIDRVTTHPDTDRQPAVSADGTTIAFSSNRPGNDSLFLIDIDGTNSRRLTAPYTDGGDLWPTWSPDGTTIAFASDRPVSDEQFVVGVNDLWVVRPDGTGLRHLYGNPDDDETAPSWSPVDDVIVFLSGSPVESDGISFEGPSFNYDVFTIRADGTGLTRLTDDGVDGGYQRPTWAPDGRSILVSRTVDGTPALYSLSVDGSTITPIPTEEVPVTAATFTPDGTRIVFSDGYDLWSMTPDGGGLHPLTGWFWDEEGAGPSIPAGP